MVNHSATTAVSELDTEIHCMEAAIEMAASSVPVTFREGGQVKEYNLLAAERWAVHYARNAARIALAQLAAKDADEAVREPIPGGSQYVMLAGVPWVLTGDDGGWFLERVGTAGDAKCPTCGEAWEDDRVIAGTVLEEIGMSFGLVWHAYGPDGVKAIDCQHCGAVVPLQYKRYAKAAPVAAEGPKV